MKFYVFDDLNDDIKKANKEPNTQYVGKWCDALEVDRINGNSEKCPECGRPVSMLKWLEPRKIKLTNTMYPDRLTTWLTEPMVISEKFIKVYEQERLTGIREYYPIIVTEVVRMKENSPRPLDYFCAEINFTKNVKVDVNKSVLVGQKTDWSCAICNPWGKTKDKIIKIALDTVNWQGEDVFRVYSFGVIVSQRFYNVIKKNNLTNFNLVSIDEYKQL